MARTLAYLLAAGVALAFLSVAVPRSLSVPDVGVAGPIAAVAITVAALVAALVIRGGLMLRRWPFQLALGGATTLVTTVLWVEGPGSRYATAYVLIVLYAAYFFSRLQAGVQLVFASSSYAAVILDGHADGGDVSRWLLTVGVLGAASLLVFASKGRLEGVISRLEAAARTDVLTGLLNRRGFDEAFESELERAKRSGRELSLIVGDLDHFKALNDLRGHTAGDDALDPLAAVMTATRRRVDSAARIGGEEFAVLVPESSEHEAYMLAERLRVVVSDAFADGEPALTISFGVAVYPRHGHTPESLFLAGDQALYAAKELGRDRTVIHNPEIACVIGDVTSRARDYEGADAFLTTVLALAEALEARGDSSASGSRVVSRYAELIARELMLAEDAVDRVRIGGLLHDVGKVGVSETVLNKPDPLDDRDWREIRRHPLIAARILDSSAVDDIRGWVLAHHERVDGLGYPNGLSGDEIPLESRILAVADAYEAMTSERVYRTALEPAEALAELERGSGSQFDPRVVGAFMRVLDRLGVRPASW
jgi:two-component system, cell cycle response regulator